MIIPIATFLLGAFFLWFGGEWLVTGSVAIARRAGLSPLFIGLTLVAFGTSFPETTFNIFAATTGHADMSFGNVVGSNIANITLVLGLTALIVPLTVHSRVIRRELPVLIAATLITVALALLPPMVGPLDGLRPGFGRIDGAALLGIFGVCSWLWLRLAKQDRRDPMREEAEEQVGATPPLALGRAVLLFVVGLAVLFVGGHLTKEGAVGIATEIGMSEAVVGLTIVALATSLPELVTSVVAARRGHGDLAVGNVVGSNLYNTLLVLGLTSVIAEVPVPVRTGFEDLAVMVVITLALTFIANTNSRRIVRLEGALLIATYVGYMTWAVIRGI